MYMVEITEDKMCDLYENVEKGIKYIGKAMQCLDELQSKSRYGYRDHEDGEDMEYSREGERKSNMYRRSRYDRY